MKIKTSGKEYIQYVMVDGRLVRLDGREHECIGGYEIIFGILFGACLILLTVALLCMGGPT